MSILFISLVEKKKKNTSNESKKNGPSHRNLISRVLFLSLLMDSGALLEEIGLIVDKILG